MRSLLLLAATAALLLSACGDDGATDVGDGGEPTVDPTPTDGLPLGAGPYPIADLTFTVGPDGLEGGTVTYRLACLGDTATFTGDPVPLDAATACLSLTRDEVRVRILDGPPADRMCTEVYGGPQVAVIAGTLDDAPVDTTVDRANGCGIDDYDRLLGELLPPAGTI